MRSGGKGNNKRKGLWVGLSVGSVDSVANLGGVKGPASSLDRLPSKFSEDGKEGAGSSLESGAPGYRATGPVGTLRKLVSKPANVS